MRPQPRSLPQVSRAGRFFFKQERMWLGSLVFANRIPIVICFVGFLLHFVDILAHASGFFRIRVCLFSRASRTRRTAAASAKLCPALAFAIWPTIARPALRAACGVGGTLNG
jgi:hypothetical protein